MILSYDEKNLESCAQMGVRNVRGNIDKEIKRNLYNEHGHILVPSAITHVCSSVDQHQIK